jgi:hypothetical protein
VFYRSCCSFLLFWFWFLSYSSSSSGSGSSSSSNSSSGSGSGSYPIRGLIDIFKFLLRKKRVVELDIILATQSIEARARQEGRASLYDWIVYKREYQAKESKKVEERTRLYT